MVIAPTINAMTAFSGMPNVSSGMNEVCAPALLADSGPATPWIAPFPKRLGSFATFFSNAYDANEASIAPPPGSKPRIEPRPVPRRTAGHACLNWSLVSQRELTLLLTSSRFSSVSRFVTISAKPNRPIATLTTPMPSINSGTPNANRAAPELTSVPTMPSRSPSTTIAIALSNDPCASTTAPIRPRIISEQYSAGPNLSASSDSGGENAATNTVETQPAKKEPSAATARAAPACPLSAIWCPSRHVTADDVSPGMLIRIDVVEPPY